MNTSLKITSPPYKMMSLLFILISATTVFAGKIQKVVAKDGSGDYTTVQAAINAAPTGATKPYIIFIKKGTYKELLDLPKGKDFITFKGEDANNTILTFDNFSKRLNPDGKEYGTSGSASFFVKADHFTAENITFENTAGISAGQALAINITGNWSAFKNCRFLGHQDTYFANNGTTQYLKNCYFAGTVDFIFGGSTAFFEDCTIHSLGNGYLTAASTPEKQAYGYVFLNCKVTANESQKKGSVYLGRPWRPYAKVVFIKTDMEQHIKPEAWHNWGKTENEKTAFYAEYASSGAGYDADKRVKWAKDLNSTEAKSYTKKKVLGNWKPI